MLKMPCKIKCYYEPEDAEQLRLIGKNPRLEEAELREITFYTIDTAINYREDGKFYGAIVSSANTYITNLSYNELNTHIQKHI